MTVLIQVERGAADVCAGAGVGCRCRRRWQERGEGDGSSSLAWMAVRARVRRHGIRRQTGSPWCQLQLQTNVWHARRGQVTGGGHWGMREAAFVRPSTLLVSGDVENDGSHGAAVANREGQTAVAVGCAR